MDLVERLADIVGPNHCLTDPDLRSSYETDWTRRWSGTAHKLFHSQRQAHLQNKADETGERVIAPRWTVILCRRLWTGQVE